MMAARPMGPSGGSAQKGRLHLGYTPPVGPCTSASWAGTFFWGTCVYTAWQGHPRSPQGTRLLGVAHLWWSMHMEEGSADIENAPTRTEEHEPHQFIYLQSKSDMLHHVRSQVSCSLLKQTT